MKETAIKGCLGAGTGVTSDGKVLPVSMILTCIPVQYEILPGQHPPAVTSEHSLGECDDCGVDIWISAEYEDLHQFDPDGYVLFCRRCAKSGRERTWVP